jgi:hypothetical protein
MPWPTGHDYQTALQSPSVSFKDPDLKTGAPELNQLGMPKPRSGAYAVAFKVHLRNRDYAVRCFLSDSLDRQNRYEQISKFLNNAALSYTVEFSYQRDGILVNGKWYPMLKMEWVHGDSLGAYVAKNVHHPQSLIALAGRWVEMSNALMRIGMAHGDLQHGNVLIMPDGQIKLIDYDGMYVPALSGRTSEELGQRNYQHPLRNAMDFGPNLDHFSEWVIYVSLVLISLQPTLWPTLKGGDECLLFRKTDFDDPENSPAFKAIESARDDRVRRLGEALRALLYFGASQVPPLDASDMPVGFQVNETVSVPSGGGGSSWLTDHVALTHSAAKVPIAEATSTAPGMGGQSSAWILDYTKPPAKPERFSNSSWIESGVLLVSVLLTTLCVYLFGVYGTVMIVPLAAGNYLLMFRRYSSLDVVRRARVSARKVGDLKRDVAAVHEQVARLERDMLADSVGLKQRLARIIAERNKIQVSEDKESERPKARLKLTVTAINETRKRLAESDAKELRDLQHGVGSQLLDAQKDLAGVDNALLSELAATLASLQEQHVLNAMNKAQLARARIPGIGTGLRDSLRRAGITTAADMKRRGLWGIPGIGPQRQSDLLNWSRSIEADAMRTRPTAMPVATEAAIKAKYSGERKRLESQRDSLQVRMTTEQTRIAAMHQAERDVLIQQERQAQAETAADLATIHDQHQLKFTANDEEGVKARADYASRVLSRDQQSLALRQKLGPANWQLASAEHGHATFRMITFARYAQRALWPLTG